MTHKGYIPTAEHRRKQSDAKKGNKNLNFEKKVWNSGTKGLMPPSWNKGTKTGKPAWNRGIPATAERKLNMSLALQGKPGLVGDKHPNWRGGISCLPYCEKWTKDLREAVRERDRHICQLCGKEQKDLTGKFKNLSVHHIHYDKENCYPDLITLCVKCNCRVNFNRKYYESLFMNQLNKRELLFWTKLRTINFISTKSN